MNKLGGNPFPESGQGFSLPSLRSYTTLSPGGLAVEVSYVSLSISRAGPSFVYMLTSGILTGTARTVFRIHGSGRARSVRPSGRIRAGYAEIVAYTGSHSQGRFCRSTPLPSCSFSSLISLQA